MNNVSEQKKCCTDCKYFEQRTKFCRYNCPTVVITEENKKTFMTAAWPKIAMPDLDWCKNFEV